MTRNDDIERVLEQWLDEGPRHMSDRLFDRTLARIERLPNERFAALGLRLPTMLVNVRLAAAAAILVAFAGAGLAVLDRLPGVGAQPSPTPTISEAPTMSRAEIALALQSMWESVGDRVSPGDWGPTDNSFNIDQTGLRIEQLHGDVLSTLTLTDGGTRIALRFQHGISGSFPSNEQWICAVGAEGIYSVRLTADGGALTLGLLSDPCAPRATFLAGDWTRASCPPAYYACRPQSPAGTQLVR